VYLTIARRPCGHITVPATTTAEPPTLPDGAVAECAAKRCPPEQVNRTTGTVRKPAHILNVPRSLAAEVASTLPATDLARPMAGVLTHPQTGRLPAVGPFNDADHLDRWWQWRGNRLATAGIGCLPAAPATTPSQAIGQGR
jgi:hypothetical protein